MMIIWMNKTYINCQIVYVLKGKERKGKDWSMKNVWMNETDIIC